MIKVTTNGPSELVWLPATVAEGPVVIVSPRYAPAPLMEAAPHDVSGEPRGDHGRWSKGGGSNTSAPKYEAWLAQNGKQVPYPGANGSFLAPDGNIFAAKKTHL